MGTSHHMFSAGEEHMGVVRNARPSLASSDQNGVFVSGRKGQCEVSVYIVIYRAIKFECSNSTHS